MTRKNKTEFCPGTSFLESFLSRLVLSYYCIWSCFPSEGGALVYIAFLPLFTAGAIFMSEPGIFILSSFMNETLSMSWKSLKYIIKDRIQVSERVWITFLLLILDTVVFGLASPAQLLWHSPYYQLRTWILEAEAKEI